jgi:hypothetical protein
MSLPHYRVAVLPGCSQVDFWVWDSGRPVLNATISRMVLIDAPCPDSSTPYFCENHETGASFCSGELMWCNALQ